MEIPRWRLLAGMAKSTDATRRPSLGWHIRPSFSVSQNRDRAQILEMFMGSFGCGTIRPDRSDKTLKYEVRSVPDLIAHVIPHFRKYPLLSAKREDFEIFAEVCAMMSRGEHLSAAGFDRIREMASTINKAGKKKYPRVEIKV